MNNIETLEYIQYELINDGEGLSVNNKFRTSQTIELSEGMTDKEIIKACKNQGFIKQNIRYNSISIEGELEYTLYVNYKGDPGFELINNKI
jgi:hypothetical protein